MLAIIRRNILLITFLCTSVLSHAQINLQHKGSAKEIFSILQNKYGYKFMYSNNDINDRKIISIVAKNATIETVLNEISKQINVSFQIINKQIVIKTNKKEVSTIAVKTKGIQSGQKSTTIQTAKNQQKNKTSKNESKKEIIPLSFKIKTDPAKQVETTFKTEKEPETVLKNKHTNAIIQVDTLREEIILTPKQEYLLLPENEPLPSNHEKAEKQKDTIKGNNNSVENSVKMPVSKNEITLNKQLENEKKQNSSKSISSKKTTARPSFSYSKSNTYEFSLQNNLLYDLLLTPNIGLECKINAKWGFAVNGLWTHLNWDDGNKTYRIWMIAPEVRYYLFKEKRFYAGAMFHIGQLNLKLSATGNQGDFIGGGLTGGYVVQLNDHFQLDFSIGVGYTYFKYDSYNYINEVNIKKDSGIKSFWGPSKVGVTLIFKL